MCFENKSALGDQDLPLPVTYTNTRAVKCSYDSCYSFGIESISEAYLLQHVQTFPLVILTET